MNFTAIIIALVIVFIISLLLLNFKNIKNFFAKFKKNKKKDKGKRNSAKNKNSKSSKLQKSQSQTRPILKPPEEKKPEEKKPVENNTENKKEENPQGKKTEYNDNVKPIIAPTKNLATNTPAITSSSLHSQNVLSGNKFNATPKVKKEDLDQEFDEIKKFLNSTPASTTKPQPYRPSFFSSDTNNSRPNFQGQMFNPNVQNTNVGFRPQNNNFQSNSNNTYNPFGINGFASKQNINEAKPMTSGDFASNFSNSFPTKIDPFSPKNFPTNSTPNVNPNSQNANAFIPQYNPFGANKNLSNLNSNLDNKNSSSAINSFNFKNTNNENGAKVKIDDDEIDLNKLSPNVKKLIISNILARRNYDD